MYIFPLSTHSLSKKVADGSKTFVFVYQTTRLKNNKAPGPDGIPSEILKEGYKCMEDSIYKLIVQIWNNEKIPSCWAEALICPIHKKGDVQTVRILEVSH